jgi:hypothetical protein
MYMYAQHLVEQLTCMHHRKVYKYGPVYSNHTDFCEMDLHPLHTRFSLLL